MNNGIQTSCIYRLPLEQSICADRNLGEERISIMNSRRQEGHPANGNLKTAIYKTRCRFDNWEQSNTASVR